MPPRCARSMPPNASENVSPRMSGVLITVILPSVLLKADTTNDTFRGLDARRVTRRHSAPSARWEDSSARRALQHKSVNKMALIGGVALGLAVAIPSARLSTI